MVIAGAGPHGEIGPNVEIGRREMDVEYNWTESFYQYTNGLNLPSFVTEQKLSTAEDEPVWDAPNVSFSNEQQAILDLLSRQFQSIETGVDSICSQLNQLLGPDSFRLLAPTDAAAVNVNGSTIHSGLSISIGKYDNFIVIKVVGGLTSQLLPKAAFIQESTKFGMDLHWEHMKLLGREDTKNHAHKQNGGQKRGFDNISFPVTFF
jgi:hypothetical protein